VCDVHTHLPIYLQARTTGMNHLNTGSMCLLTTTSMLYMFRTHLHPSSGAVWSVTAATGICHELGWNKSCIDVKVGEHCIIPWPKGDSFWTWNNTVLIDLEHLHNNYSIPPHDKHQWLLLQFIVLLIMDAKGVRNM